MRNIVLGLAILMMGIGSVWACPDDELEKVIVRQGPEAKVELKSLEGGTFTVVVQEDEEGKSEGKLLTTKLVQSDSEGALETLEAIQKSLLLKQGPGGEWVIEWQDKEEKEPDEDQVKTHLYSVLQKQQPSTETVKCPKCQHVFSKTSKETVHVELMKPMLEKIQIRAVEGAVRMLPQKAEEQNKSNDLQVLKKEVEDLRQMLEAMAMRLENLPD